MSELRLNPGSILIFGGGGWLGGRLAGEFHAKVSKVDVTDRGAIMAELDRIAPEVVINAAGKTGRPNIDGCEADPAGTLAVNTAAPILVAEECLTRGIFMVHLGSGCVYDHSKAKYTEEDPPNFFGSIYSRSKALSEAALKNLPVLQLRIRMPFDGIPHQRNLITKLVGYPKVISVPNSLTYVPDLIRVCRELVKRREVGIWNVVNPGQMVHPQILSLYQSLVDPNHAFEEMSLEGLSLATKAGRSNCILSTKKLEKAGLAMRPVEEAVKEALIQYRSALHRPS